MSTPAGWYPDPEQAETLRYWTGVNWTDQRVPTYNRAIPARAPREVWLAYVLLLLIGGLGIHRFYVGDTASGITILILTLVGWATSVIAVGFILLAVAGVWLLVDLFLVPSIVDTANKA